jgi:hypothetical protein
MTNTVPKGSERTTYSIHLIALHFSTALREEKKKGGAPLHYQALISVVGARCEKRDVRYAFVV